MILMECCKSVVEIYPELNYVVKRYREGYSTQYTAELRMFERLKGLVFLPKFLSCQDSTLSIKMTYAGEIIRSSTCPKDWLNQVQVMAEQLKEAKCYIRGLVKSNILVKDKRIYLIDLAMFRPCGPRKREEWRKNKTRLVGWISKFAK